MTWSADFPADDWRPSRRTRSPTHHRAVEAQGKGIVLLHDIQPATALAFRKF